MKFLRRFARMRDEFGVGAYNMILSSLCVALFSLFGKLATESTPFFFLTFLRFSVPFILMLPILLWKNSIKELFKVNSLRHHFLRATCLIVYQYSIFYYLTKSTLLNALVLQNTFPLFLPVLERIFYKRPFHTKELISIIVCFAGVLCILQPERGIFQTLSIVAILAPLSQAGSQILFSHVTRLENPSSNLFYFYFLPSAVTAVVFLFSTELFVETPPHAIFPWICILFLSIVNIFSQIFRAKAYQCVGNPSSLAPFLYFSLIFSAILDWLIFHSLPNVLSVVGGLLVIAGGLIQVYKSRS